MEIFSFIIQLYNYVKHLHSSKVKAAKKKNTLTEASFHLSPH